MLTCVCIVLSLLGWLTYDLSMCNINLVTVSVKLYLCAMFKEDSEAMVVRCTSLMHGCRVTGCLYLGDRV